MKNLICIDYGDFSATITNLTILDDNVDSKEIDRLCRIKECFYDDSSGRIRESVSPHPSGYNEEVKSIRSILALDFFDHGADETRTRQALKLLDDRSNRVFIPEFQSSNDSKWYGSDSNCVYVLTTKGERV